MLHFITDAPEFVVREIMAFARGWVEDASDYDLPSWAESIVHVHEDNVFSVLNALVTFRVEGRKPARVAIADPTYAIAAQSIERDGGFGSTPAAAFAR